MDREQYNQHIEAVVAIMSMSAAGMYLTLHMEPRKSPTEWVKSFLRSRSTRGAHATLMQELISYPAEYRNYMRMSEEKFTFLLDLIRNDVGKKNTTMRVAIAPEDRLAVTLRFLAAGRPSVILMYY